MFLHQMNVKSVESSNGESGGEWMWKRISSRRLLYVLFIASKNENPSWVVTVILHRCVAFQCQTISILMQELFCVIFGFGIVT